MWQRQENLKVLTQGETRMTRMKLKHPSSTPALCVVFAPSVSIALIGVASVPVRKEICQITVGNAKSAQHAIFALYCVTQFAHLVALLMK
ncbi:uncharacterized protein KZ484_011453 isoform 3-T3 [Pholidichthys leucotaenia]